MSQRGIEIADLVGDIAHLTVIGMMVYRPHQRQTVENHQYYHADIFGKRQQKISEVFTPDKSMAAVER